MEAFIFNPELDFVAPIKLTIACNETSGFPRQFMLIKENILCSILFHLLVPGGKWHTLTCIPVSFENFCISIFQSLPRDELLPPPSAVIIISFTLG